MRIGEPSTGRSTDSVVMIIEKPLEVEPIAGSARDCNPWRRATRRARPADRGFAESRRICQAFDVGMCPSPAEGDDGAMESKVQVGGSLNTPAYEWPLKTGIALCVLAPISYGLRLGRWRGLGRLRGLLAILRWIGPWRFLIGAAVALLFALAVRQARQARRRDLEIAPDGFAMIDRRGRREFEDGEVQALAFRSRSAAVGTVAVQRGRASLWVDGREGPDRLELDWEYPDAEPDPLAQFLGRIADLLHARAVKAIDSGLTIEGEGWELSRQGLQVGEAFEIMPFTSIAKAEYHDGYLMIWSTGQVEPSVKFVEGTKNDAILHAILIERIPAPRPEDRLADPSTEGLGRVLFERRPSLSDKIALWGLCLLLAGLFTGVAILVTQKGTPILVGVVSVALVCLSFVPALMRQRELFRFREHGVMRSGLFGIQELPFDDLAGVRFQPLSNQQLLKVVFHPIPGRGRKKVSVTLKPTDEALETIRAYVPGELIVG
jgi:hypothetical protein